MVTRYALAVIAIVLAVSLPALAGDAPQGVVNINTATAEQLQLLPRVGPALADRIIEFRQSNGPFGSVDELVAVKGIGERSLANLEPFVTTQGATTLDAKVKLPRTTSPDDGA